MPKDTKTLGNNKARACESLGFVHKKGCVRVLTQPLFTFALQERGKLPYSYREASSFAICTVCNHYSVLIGKGNK